jgi:hypothetical protein
MNAKHLHSTGLATGLGINSSHQEKNDLSDRTGAPIGGARARHPGADSWAQTQALLDEVQAARFLVLSERTLQHWRLVGGGPPFVRLGRAIRYSVEDLEKFIAARKFNSTADATVHGGR